jgi:hypothetical protein
VSDINPMTGKSASAVEAAPRAVPAQVSFEDPTRKSLESPAQQGIQELINSPQAEEFAMLAELASKTKFATGNVETDIRNYLRLNSISQQIAGFLSNA